MIMLFSGSMVAILESLAHAMIGRAKINFMVNSQVVVMCRCANYRITKYMLINQVVMCLFYLYVCGVRERDV